MGYQKPAEISDQEWAQTPPAVQALLAQSIEHLRKTQPESVGEESVKGDTAQADDATAQHSHFSPLPNSTLDEEATIDMPSQRVPSDKGQTPQVLGSDSEFEDGGTIAMPLSDLPEDDGSTINMPLQSDPSDTGRATQVLGSDSEFEDGGTISMPFNELPEGDGATVNMPLQRNPPDTKRSTLALGLDSELEDGGTIAMPFADSLEEDRSTMVLPVDDILPDDHNIPDDESTLVMAAHASDSEDDGRTTMMSDPRVTDVPDALTTVVVTPSETQPSPSQPVKPDDIAVKNIVLKEKYRLQKILGKGGFGAAYLAEDIVLERECVVKQMLSSKGVMPKELALNQANFKREARLLANLNSPGHPNIPDIYDYFSDESGSYLVMKYIEGQSLEGMIKSSQDTIPWREAVRYTLDVCSALDYMHTHGEEPVMHRDIKPANILLGDDGRIWLVDFGLARTKPVKDSDDLAAADASGSVGFTPFEQWLGEAVPASDVYATSVTLHFMVTGLSPLEAYRENGKVQVNIQKMQELHGQIEPIRKVNRKLPKELDEIIKSAAAPEPEQRLTALQLQQQLEVLISGAKDAALFTFKNGQSAKTIGELVDLCEQNRVEAQGYLYRGEFERWFTLINRNDLADAAAKAVKQESKGKDGLERFLKLIMPHLFWRRFGRASLKVAWVGLQLLLILAIALLIVIVLSTLGGRWFLQRSIASRDWDYYSLDLDKDNVFPEDYLTENGQSLTRAYLGDIQVDTLSPNQVDLNASLGGMLWFNIPVGLRLEDDHPRISLTEVNGMPLYWVTDNLSAGVNSGIDEALNRAPIKIIDLEVDDEAVIFKIDKSDVVTYAPPTPEPDATSTPTPTPIPTPTPPGMALLAIFNDLNRAVILKVGSQRWTINANDTKVIEKPPGTYDYTLIYAENGQLAATGSRTWDYRAYRWRITEQGEIIE